MELSEAAEILRRHNAWRRYNGHTGEPGAPQQQPPAALGTAIEVAARAAVLLGPAMMTLQQIESTPRNRGARRNARATLRFIETQLDIPPR